MNKKQLMMTSLLLILMVALIFSQKLFDNSFKEVALLDNDIQALKEYSIKEGEYKFLLPEEWSIEEKNSNSYNIYKAEFKDKKGDIVGYIDVINTKEDIKALAQKDIDNLLLPHYKERIDNYRDNKWNGIRVNYKTKVKGGYSFMNCIYYIKLDDEKIGKFSFIVKANIYKDNMKAIFDTLVSSMKNKGK